MGVRGLSTFFDNNPQFSKPHKLQNTTVIIDGNNLIHQLYFRYKIDCIYGGDYNKYASAVRKYFSPFLECNIQPILVLDGGYDPSDRKFCTVLERCKKRLTQTRHIAKYGVCSGSVLPIHAPQVFQSVLREIGIHLVQADFEADEQIAALANYYDCPVLSDDSDFYIFDIKRGFIRLSSVNTTVVEDCVDGVLIKYLDCSIYHIDKFLAYFPGIDRSILPLFATLVGNDFANSQDFATFFSNIHLPKQKHRGLKLNPKQKQIIGLLSWLKNWNLEEGINQVLNHLKKDRRPNVAATIYNSLQVYMTAESKLTFVIEGNITSLRKAISLEQRHKFPCGYALPVPFVIAFHQGILPPYFINIIHLHRTFLKAQVEDLHSESSYSCSRTIRQVLYGILLQHVIDDDVRHSSECVCPVIEYDRRKGYVQKVEVPPLYSLKSGQFIPSLYTIYCSDYDMSRDFLLEVLEAEDMLLEVISSNWHLLFIAIRYWLKKTSTPPQEEMIVALVLNIMYFSLILPLVKSDGDRKNIKDPSVPFSFQECAIPSDVTRLPKEFTESSKMVEFRPEAIPPSPIPHTEAEVASHNMKKYLQTPTYNHAKVLRIDTIHAFSQLQTCLLYATHLNSVLRCPLPHPNLHRDTLSGILLYNLTQDLCTRHYPDLFVAELLGRQSYLHELFLVVKNRLLDGLPEGCYIRISRSFSKKKKKSNRKSKEGDGSLCEKPLKVIDDSKCEIYI